MSKDRLEELIEQSKGSDIQALLTAKEKAKMAAATSPTTANMSALDKATRMFEMAMEKKAMQEKTVLDSYKDVLAYAEECGRKLAKTKFYSDVKLGRVKKQPDGSFRIKDVDRYFLTLPTLGTPDGVAEKVADRMRRKEEAEIRRAEAVAKREEFDLDVRLRKYIPREQLYQELAVRAVVLQNSLKTMMEAHVVDFVEIVGGDASLSENATTFFSKMIDECMGEYAKPMTIEVDIFDIEENEETVAQS